MKRSSSEILVAEIARLLTIRKLEALLRRLSSTGTVGKNIDGMSKASIIEWAIGRYGDTEFSSAARKFVEETGDARNVGSLPLFSLSGPVPVSVGGSEGNALSVRAVKRLPKSTHLQRPVLAHTIRTLRTKRGLSITALAQRSGVTLSSVSAIEAGTRPNPGADTLLALAIGLRVSLDELMSYDVSALPPEPIHPTTIDGMTAALEMMRRELSEQIDRLSRRAEALEGRPSTKAHRGADVMSDGPETHAGAKGRSVAHHPPVSR